MPDAGNHHYNPDQPRDARGRWTGDGATAPTPAGWGWGLASDWWHRPLGEASADERAFSLIDYVHKDSSGGLAPPPDEATASMLAQLMQKWAADPTADDRTFQAHYLEPGMSLATTRYLRLAAEGGLGAQTLGQMARAGRSLTSAQRQFNSLQPQVLDSLLARSATAPDATFVDRARAAFDAVLDALNPVGTAQAAGGREEVNADVMWDSFAPARRESFYRAVEELRKVDPGNAKLTYAADQNDNPDDFAVESMWDEVYQARADAAARESARQEAARVAEIERRDRKCIGNPVGIPPETGGGLPRLNRSEEVLDAARRLAEIEGLTTKIKLLDPVVRRLSQVKIQDRLAPTEPEVLKVRKALEDTRDDVALQIGSEHGYRDHGQQFKKNVNDYVTRAEYQEIIVKILKHADVIKPLDRNRVAFWSSERKAVVLRYPNMWDGGTAFVPDNGIRYLDDLD